MSLGIVCGLTFPRVRITFAALLEGSSVYLYESGRQEKRFITYWLKKVRNDYLFVSSYQYYIGRIRCSGLFG